MWFLPWQCNSLVNAQSSKGESSSFFAVQSLKGNAGQDWPYFPTWGLKRQSQFTFTLCWASLCHPLSWVYLNPVLISFKCWKLVLPFLGNNYGNMRLLFWGLGCRWELQTCGSGDGISNGLTLWGPFFEVWGEEMTALGTRSYSSLN